MLAALAVWVGVLGAASVQAGEWEMPEPALLSAPRTDFDVSQDTFAFANGLRWSYSDDDPEAPEPVPLPESNQDFDQRCSQMARAARQFYYASRFAPSLPRRSEGEYQELIARVMKSDPRQTAPAEDPVVIPGFSNLHELSLALPETVKKALGGRWRAYFQRGNWRMVFAFSPEHQRRTADELLASLERGHPPIVHVMNFPHVTVNHTLLLHRAEATPLEILFQAYDPNNPGNETVLHYERAEARFDLQETRYWPGGRVTAYEVFRGLLY